MHELPANAALLRPHGPALPHCKEKRRTDVWATIGPERAARTRRARQLAGGELTTAPGHNPVAGPDAIGGPHWSPSGPAFAAPASVVGRRRPTAATTRCGLDDQEVPYPAADARSLQPQCRRPWLARTARLHVARGRRLKVTRETATLSRKAAVPCAGTLTYDAAESESISSLCGRADDRGDA
jgi:hypothetical protein